MHSSPILSSTFHEQDPKFGYSKLDPNRKQPLREKIQMYKDGIQDIKTGVKKWKEEFHDTLDPQVDITPHETQVIWKFDESTINNWIVTCDSDNREGLSTANLSVSTLGHGMFSGTLNSHVPQDGKLKRSGYCNLRSTRHRKSFEREDYYKWPLYTHLVIRCRGDGRSFMINLHTPGEFDLTWGDMYSYLLYTRGGPYWQVSKIPFSKFFFQSKGRVQDLQDPLPIDRVSSIGLSMMDQNNGPFQLELDYIGVEFDPSHDEEFAYEMYLLENEVRGIVHW